jgi:hypothetical protein
MDHHRVGCEALCSIAGQTIELLAEDVRLDLDDVDIEFVTLPAPAQDFAHRFDTRHAAANDDNRGTAFPRGELVESGRDPLGIIDGAEPQRELVRALDTEGIPYAAGRHQAGIVVQRVPALRLNHVAVVVDPGNEILNKGVAVTVYALGPRQHDALAVFHPRQQFMDVGRPFEVGARIDHGNIVIAGKAGCGDKAGEIAANNDDTGAGWGHCLQIWGLLIALDVTPFFEKRIGNPAQCFGQAAWMIHRAAVDYPPVIYRPVGGSVSCQSRTLYFFRTFSVSSSGIAST